MVVGELVWTVFGPASPCGRRARMRSVEVTASMTRLWVNADAEEFDLRTDRPRSPAGIGPIYAREVQIFNSIYRIAESFRASIGFHGPGGANVKSQQSW